MGSNIIKWDPGNSKQVQYHMYRHMALHIMGMNLYTHELPSKDSRLFVACPECVQCNVGSISTLFVSQLSWECCIMSKGQQSILTEIAVTVSREIYVALDQNKLSVNFFLERLTQFHIFLLEGDAMMCNFKGKGSHKLLWGFKWKKKWFTHTVPNRR